MHPRVQAVVDLAQQGKTPLETAEELGIPRGEVQVIRSVKRHTASAPAPGFVPASYLRRALAAHGPYIVRALFVEKVGDGPQAPSAGRRNPSSLSTAGAPPEREGRLLCVR